MNSLIVQLPILAYASLRILCAAIVRGLQWLRFFVDGHYCDLAAAPPVEIVLWIFLMEVASSFYLLPEVWREIHWRSLSWLFLGCCLGTLLGVYILAHLPAAPMTLALAVFVLVATRLLASGFHVTRMPGSTWTFATGTYSVFIMADLSCANLQPFCTSLTHRAVCGRSRVAHRLFCPRMLLVSPGRAGAV